MKFQLIQHLPHPPVQRRTHAIPFFGAVELYPRNAVLNRISDSIVLGAGTGHDHHPLKKKQRKNFFFEKKKQKTFVLFGPKLAAPIAAQFCYVV
jgi:hypothetical protein